MGFPPRLKTDKEMGRTDRRELITMDCDICSSCGEHADWEESDDGDTLSACCGAGPYDTDPDIDMER